MGVEIKEMVIVMNTHTTCHAGLGYNMGMAAGTLGYTHGY